MKYCFKDKTLHLFSVPSKTDQNICMSCIYVVQIYYTLDIRCIASTVNENNQENLSKSTFYYSPVLLKQ